ncbi:MAG: FecR domain-containing protein [Chloroflexi bacterium]|nr:FecR domain-containing protein [Chloroflexota bacterium]
MKGFHRDGAKDAKSFQMKNLAARFIWLMLLIVTACAGRAATPPSPASTTQPPSQPNTLSPSLTPSPASRTATLAEIINQVKSRLSSESAWGEATVGQTLPVGGEVKTGSDGESRIDLSPDTIVRIGPDTHFTVAELSGDDQQPDTLLNLISGEVWVVLNSALNGGSFEVETPIGSASVRGSYLSVDYDATSDSLIVSCLEGQCHLRNDFGIVDLLAEQETFIARRGLAPEPPRPMDPERLERWRQFVREAAQLIDPASTRLASTWVAPDFIATRQAIQTLVPRPPRSGFFETLIAQRTPLAPGILLTRRP